MRYAQGNATLHALGTANDPLYPSQWGLPDIGAPKAWDISEGSGVSVAVIDTGIDSTHPDLAGNVVLYRNYVNPAATAADDEGHGTHVAGIIAAVRNNAAFGAGTAPKATLYAFKVLDSTGAGDDAGVSSAIRDAVDLTPCRIISMSLGGPGSDPALEDAVAHARSHGRHRDRGGGQRRSVHPVVSGGHHRGHRGGRRRLGQQARILLQLRLRGSRHRSSGRGHPLHAAGRQDRVVERHVDGHALRLRRRGACVGGPPLAGCRRRDRSAALHGAGPRSDRYRPVPTDTVSCVPIWHSPRSLPLPDTTAPTTTSDAKASYVGTATVHLTATDNAGGSGVAHTYHVLDGGAQAEGTTLIVGAAGPHVARVLVAGHGGKRRDTAQDRDVHGDDPVLLASSTLTIRSSTYGVKVGAPFQLTGALTPGSAGDPVVAYVKKPGSARWSYSSARLAYASNGSGGALWWYRYTPRSRGTYQFQARFAGDLEAGPSVSRNIAVSVR